MASLVIAPFSSTASSWCFSTPSCRKAAPFLPSLSPSSSSSSLISYPRSLKLGLSTSSPQLGLVPFPLWSGLKNLGISMTPISHQKGRKVKCKGRVVVKASLFGVGAPEALVIGVVALLVFGPKGLAEVARNLGKTLRAFQPTIRELQEVSREFRSTLEREIGLDETSSSMQNTSSSRTNIASTPSAASVENSASVSDVNGASSPRRAYTSEEYLNITEQQLKAVAAQEQQEQSASSQLETQNQPNVGATPLPPKQDNEV